MENRYGENRYGSLASRVYHLDKPVGRSFGDIEFYRDRLAGCQGPVLEPACGNGRVLIPLLESGLDISGFDFSHEMIGHCRRECEMRGLAAPVEIASFSNFSREEPFAAIIVPAGSLQLIAEPREMLAVLKRFHAALKPGGRLIADLDSLAGLADPPGAARQWQDGDDLLTLTEQRVETCFRRQTSLAQLRYEHWRADRLLASELQLFRLRFWGEWEFELALRAAGFTDIRIYGDYQTGAASHSAAQVVTFEAFASHR